MEKEDETEEDSKKYNLQEVLDKYNISLEKLKSEQLRLSKNLEIKDSFDFNIAERIAGIDSVFFKNRIISVVIVLVGNEIVEQEYFEDKIKFPYLSEFRAYRELPTMVSAFNKLDQKPDVVFIRGSGILHPRGLGIASHFSLSTGVACIGVADSLLFGEIQGEDILINGVKKGKVLFTKQGANPVYISPGNKISLKTAVELTKRFTREPHKIPEPLRIAKKYAKEIRKEIFG